MAGLTLDAGALIGWERGDDDVRALLAGALDEGFQLSVSAATVAEVWRGGPRSARTAMLLKACQVDAVSLDLAQRAGELLGGAGSSAALDAIVVATAERRRHRVLTCDANDVEPIAALAGVEVRAI